MLPFINRLKRKKDFDNLFKKGLGYREDFLYLKVAKNNLGITRFGFIVGKKFSSKATIRNKIKRRLREIIRKKLNYIQKGVDGVFIVMPGFKANNFLEIEQKMDKLLKKARIIQKDG